MVATDQTNRVNTPMGDSLSARGVGRLPGRSFGSPAYLYPTSRDVTAPQATITGAKIALVGTIMTALIGATATITVALVQQNNRVPTPAPPGPVPRTTGATPSAASSSTPPSTRAPINTTPATPDGVTYQCTGSAPAVRSLGPPTTLSFRLAIGH